MAGLDLVTVVLALLPLNVAFLRTRPRIAHDSVVSGCVSPHKATNAGRRRAWAQCTHPQPPKVDNPQISYGAHDRTGCHETPCMKTPSRALVVSRAKARAMGIPLPDLLGPEFTRLFHDTYVTSGQMITLQLRTSTIMRRLPAATHASHHTAVRLWGGVAPDSADIHLSMASREARCRRAGVAAHLGMQGAHTTVRDGIRMSTPIQAFLDLASAGAS